jgi:putative hemolysin
LTSKGIACVIHSRSVISWLLLLQLAAACSPRLPAAAATAQPDLANPASVYCVQQGAKLDLRTSPGGGVLGICAFADGSECEEWAYFRGQCKPGDSLGAPAAIQPADLTLASLQNARFHSPDWGDFQLVDGVYHRPPSAPGESPDTNLTQMLEIVAYGDLNADGVRDAVVFLSTQTGGTGHFREMAAMLNRGGQPYNVSTVSLGDRVVIESAQVSSGLITLDMRVHGPNDGLCCPSQLETWRFQFQADQLVRLQP